MRQLTLRFLGIAAVRFGGRAKSNKIANAIRLYGYDDVTTHCDEIETTITSIINLILVSALIRNRRPRGARIDQNQLREGSSGLRDAKIYSRIMAVN